MNALADDPTSAAVLAEAPCFPIPPSGRSPMIDGVRASRTGMCLAIGQDGVMLILRRPWLELDVPVAPAIRAYLPYGRIGDSRAFLRCGLIPRPFFERIIDHFRAALPDEAGAFILWDEGSQTFSLHFPQVDKATPTRLVYQTPILSAGQHMICDIHSHGHGAAFFSTTDDADDIHATKLSLVVGHLSDPAGPVTASRLCAGGMFLPLPVSPFAGVDHAN